MIQDQNLRYRRNQCFLRRWQIARAILPIWVVKVKNRQSKTCLLAPLWQPSRPINESRFSHRATRSTIKVSKLRRFQLTTRMSLLKPSQWWAPTNAISSQSTMSSSFSKPKRTPKDFYLNKGKSKASFSNRNSRLRINYSLQWSNLHRLTDSKHDLTVWKELKVQRLSAPNLRRKKRREAW
jgi:hypothetical protein